MTDLFTFTFCLSFKNESKSIWQFLQKKQQQQNNK